MILIALGANLPSRFGAPEKTLEAAIHALERSGAGLVATSRVWITEPVPKSDQPLYRNAVVIVESELRARDLLSLLHDVEEELGRVRSVRNAPRLIDLDLIAYNDEIINEGEAGLVLPHPRMQSRGFVLAPLCDVAPEWVHPVLGKTARALLDVLSEEGEIYPLEGSAA